jgi:proteasome lid subunit RPN8/RPN11
MENADHSTTSYMLDSREQFQVFDQMEKEGLAPVAIFHSHPHSPAVPSTRDLELAFYPDSLYLIISLMDSDSPEGHVYHIAEGRVQEVEMEVVEDGH